jgi:putative transposase
MVAYSDGSHETVANPRHLAAAQTRLAGLQRKAARQTRGSNRHRATARRLARAHARVANLRRDGLHKLTTRLAHTVDTITVEDLNVDGMARRKPGAGARGRGFNRAVRDTAFAEFRRQLTYKAHWYGCELIVADRWAPTSKTCSDCGTARAKLSLSERTFTCGDCGAVLDRDLNAARNLLSLARSGRESLNGRREPGAVPARRVIAAAGTAGGSDDRTATSTTQPPTPVVAASDVDPRLATAGSHERIPALTGNGGCP